jgi:hypothetical protein
VTAPQIMAALGVLIVAIVVAVVVIDMVWPE